MKALLVMLAVLFITGCAQLGPKVVETTTYDDGRTVDATYSEAAYAQKVISESSNNDCDVKVTDLGDVAESNYLLLASHGLAPDLCGKNSQGRNYFDAKSEVAQSRHGAVKSVIGTIGKVLTGKIIADAVVDTAETIASNSGDRYNVDVNQNNSSSSSGGEATSSEGIENATAGTTPSTGTGGSGGSPSSTQDGPDNNIINIGSGNVAIAEERAAAGQSALLNGDSAVIANIKGELKASNVGEDVATDQDGFDDSGEGSNNSLIDL